MISSVLLWAVITSSSPHPRNCAFRPETVISNAPPQRLYPKRHSCTSLVTFRALGLLTAEGLTPKLKLPSNRTYRMADFSLSAWSRRVRQSADVVSSRMGDSGVLVHLQTNRIFEVNATGLRIWELAGDGRTLLDIKERLQREFEVEPERLERELLALVAELSREGMLDDDNPQ